MSVVPSICKRRLAGEKSFLKNVHMLYTISNQVFEYVPKIEAIYQDSCCHKAKAKHAHMNPTTIKFDIPAR